MKDRMPAEVFPPGDFLKEELDARGWTQNDLADILDRPTRLVSEIINGKRRISPETALDLARAFSTSAEYWLNLESIYQLSRTRKPDTGVSHRARLYDKAPIKDMVKRNWIEGSENPLVLERNILDFLEIDSLKDEPSFMAHAARKSTSYQDVSPAQTAWLFRCKQMAKTIAAAPFTQDSFSTALEDLRALWQAPEEARHVPRVLADGGIRFLIVEALPRTKIDGACFWLDDTSPVIAVSLRYDRIDYFWHTVMHELGHVKNKDGLTGSCLPIDTDLFGKTDSDQKPQCETEADQFAVANLVPQDELENFIVRVKPMYPKTRLLGFANLIRVHPGIVLGQLQHRGEITYAKNRELLVKIRHIAASWALTDGFGNMPSASL